MKMNRELLLRSYGCFVLGAIGDAIGYPVEFHSRAQILLAHKKEVEDFLTEEPLFSDDTQMSLYTASGLLHSLGMKESYLEGIQQEYLCWYEGQCGLKTKRPHSYLRSLDHLNDQRAPGGTCLSALEKALESGKSASIKEPYNTSKGCGGVMRVAPIGLFAAARNLSSKEACSLGGDAAAITHGGKLGYLPAAYLSSLIYHLAYGHELVDSTSLAMADVEEVYVKDEEFEAIVNKAICLASSSDGTPYERLVKLGEGWVGEEALAIALFCALTYPHDIRKAMSLAVNHDGDSDSAGAILGNILGCYLGMREVIKAYPNYRKVEYCGVLLSLAEDLLFAFPTKTKKAVLPNGNEVVFGEDTADPLFRVKYTDHPGFFSLAEWRRFLPPYEKRDEVYQGDPLRRFIMLHTYWECLLNPRLASSLDNVTKNQEIYHNGESLPNGSGIPTTNVILSHKRSYEAAKAYNGKKVAVLNFASAVSPGGSPFTARAQEECLCQCSALYPALLEAVPYYHNLHLYDWFVLGNVDPTGLGTDDMIYSPGVLVFKDDATYDEIEPFEVDVITSAAPRLDGNYDEATYRKCIAKRIDLILSLAESKGVEVLILGAYGCGVFNNPPDIVAETFRESLRKHHFETVEFAVYDSPRNPNQNYTPFARAFGKE